MIRKLSDKQLKFSFAILALLCVLVIAVFVTKTQSPFVLKHIHTLPVGSGLIAYHDLDKNYFSEWYSSSKRDNFLTSIVFKSYQNAIFNQFNIYDKPDLTRLSFGDYTGDGFDEAILFASSQDSLFIYIMDVIQKQYILERHFLFHISDHHPYAKIIDAQLVNFSNTNQKQLLFIYNNGLHPHPRGVYLFDINAKKIIRRFENPSSMNSLKLIDLDRDGRTEIIVSSFAHGNTDDNSIRFHDHTCWLFVLNQDLQLLYEPISMGGYPSSLQLQPISKYGPARLVVLHTDRSGPETPHPLTLYLYNEKMEMISQKKLKLGHSAQIIKGTKDRYHISVGDNRLVTIDANLNILNIVETDEPDCLVLNTIDLNNDGSYEVLVKTGEKYLVFDEELQLLAEYPVTGYLSYRYNGKGKNIDLCFSGKDKFQILAFKENPIRKWIWLLSPILAALIFGILISTHHASVSLNLYIQFFLYSIRSSTKGIILFDAQGNIRYFNGRIQNMLRFNPPLSKGLNYMDALEKFPTLSGCVAESFNTTEPSRSDLTFKENNIHFNGRLSIVPFKLPFGFASSWLFELQDHSQSIQSERQRVWSHTIQEMAHGIKTPLAAIRLNLETIRMKLGDSNPEIIKNVDGDFSLVSSELERLREMTSQFLKFTNLEKPNIRPVKLSEILEKLKLHFQSYLENGVKLDIKLANSLELILGDENQLSMLLQIMIENAIDAIKGQGSILLEFNLEDFLDQPGIQQLAITIADSGKGILKEQRAKLFEPYYTTKSEGTGMGLAIAEKIAHDHGGRIELADRPGFGAVFLIFLPQNI